MPSPDPPAVEVTDETQHEARRTRRVRVSALDPDGNSFDSQPPRMIVDISMTEINGREPWPPTIHFTCNGISRQQWEILKRLGDAAWARWDKGETR